MFVRISSIVFLIVFTLTASSRGPHAHADDASTAFLALVAAERGNAAEARALAAQTGDPVLRDLVLWSAATRPDADGAAVASFAELAQFVENNPDWPQPRLLRQRAEEALDDNVSDQAVLAYFAARDPVTLAGARRYANALIARGDSERAAAVVGKAWAEVDAQAVEEEEAFYASFLGLLTTEDTARRLDRLLWAGRTTSAQRLLGRVDADTQAVAEARIALRQGSSSAPDLLALVPASRQGDPGLIYEQVRWNRKQGADSVAEALLLQYPVDAADPDDFWQERQLLARRRLSQGDPAQAARLAAQHGFTSGSEFIDAEWLAGWIKLRFLQDAEGAQRHFLAMFEQARHPGSRSRGAYWSGRAYEAQNDADARALWYRTAAQHPTTFHGQLAWADVRPQQPLQLPADPRPDAAERAQFEQHTLVRAVRWLTVADRQQPKKAFLLRLTDVSDAPSWRYMTAALSNEIDRPDLGVFVARQSLRTGVPLVEHGYPLLTPPNGVSLAQPVEAPLVLAVVRQESSFDPRAISPAGAMGLMQLMPGTARQVASRLGVPYSAGELTSNTDYNMTLGSSYLSGLLSRFGGSYVLALTAYNAGPGRVNEWLRTNGDPRTSATAAIDWIEMIPFNETRNYVQRCLENLQIYRVRTGEVQLAQTLDGDLLR